MSVMNLVWLALGLGLGVVVSWQFHRANQDASPVTPTLNAGGSLEEAVTLPAQLDALHAQVEQLELAYWTAAEQSQLKGGFLTRISHELRSPLNGVIGMHQLILSDLCDDPQEEREFIRQANDSALKMVQLIDEVIDVARVEQGTSQLKMQPVSLAKLFSTLKSLTHLQARNRSIRLHIPVINPPDVFVWADADRLQQALVSLIDTTISHLQEGEIIVTAQSAADDSTTVVWIDQPLAMESWSDRSWMPPAPISEPPDFPDPGAIAQLIAVPFPSAGFTFTLAQRLLQSMHGQLELLPAEALSSLSRLQITIPQHSG